MPRCHTCPVRVPVVASIMLLATAGTAGAPDALLRIERPPGADRNPIIAAGVELVLETEDAWIAVGDPAVIAATAAGFSLATTTVADPVPAGPLALVGLRPGWDAGDLGVCGRVVTAGEGWHLIEGDAELGAGCLEAEGWFIRRLDLEPLSPHRPAPALWRGLAEGTSSIVPDPLVQEIVDLVDSPLAMAHWAAISQSPTWTTRHSSSQGCATAAAWVHGLFTDLGLDAEYQHHTSGYADNVIGTLAGVLDPDQVHIAIGHLDDLPSSGPAPGADDNASGTAMVTAAAEVMSGYCFARTVKFLAVTGEEQGLYGSDHYADDAAARGEDIQAVLNADMIGWQGDGQPATEDLDVNYNTGSAWLAQAMVDAAAAYATGLPVNAFLCSSMTYSDHAPFWSNGFSAICGITDNEGFCGEGGNYPYYHQSSDTIANCGPAAPAFETAAIRTYVATLAHLAGPLARIPGQPTSVAAAPDGPNRIAVSWAPPLPGVVHRVMRATGGCASPGPWREIGESATSSFVDTTASGGVPYAYSVTAVAAGVCSSAVSACVEASTTGVCTEPPTFTGADRVVNAALSSCRLDIEWLPPDHVWCGGPVSYNVYRSTSPGFEPSPATLITGGLATPGFTDLDVVYDEVYRYVVRAVDQANGAEDSNTREVAGSPTGPAVIGTWTDDAGDSSPARLVGEPPWALAAGAGVTGAAYATGPYDPSTCAALTTPELILDGTPQLVFWSKYDLETGWDKGELQVSTDGGGSWSRVAMSYPGSSSNNNDACGLGTGAFFTGSRATYAPFTADLSALSGQTIRLRWLMSSDGYIEGDGWWVDDLSLSDVAIPGTCVGAELIFADGFESGSTAAWSP
ncbi:MAG: M28 family peptidase [Thermoanaerobaculales bacterium]|jgi:hypothetical protein|nr:M28 family peptidase [Thermoanaerobaculales bacterium]